MTSIVDNLTDCELIRKKKALEHYLQSVNDEIKRRRSSGITIPHTVPLYPQLLSSSNEPNEKQLIPKKKPSPKVVRKIVLSKQAKKNPNTESGKKDIKATMSVIKSVLSKNSIQFKSSDRKADLCDLIRKNNLVRICEREAMT